ncbi:hypothetical protein CJA_2289 [Cellvibrio japonicus Ueda107]|uniref:Uncharacterized protein n=1 Tax=Cellvibrio japonicus (strain Ueda107) TaxID=498211 RepID=B3PJS8_CELJU|nr:hypothetical protein CJA_2289 [Cellvibrio japonicus Ueda107]
MACDFPSLFQAMVIAINNYLTQQIATKANNTPIKKRRKINADNQFTQIVLLLNQRALFKYQQHFLPSPIDKQKNFPLQLLRHCLCE